MIIIIVTTTTTTTTHIICFAISSTRREDVIICIKRRNLLLSIFIFSLKSYKLDGSLILYRHDNKHRFGLDKYACIHDCCSIVASSETSPSNPLGLLNFIYFDCMFCFMIVRFVSFFYIPT